MATDQYDDGFDSYDFKRVGGADNFRLPYDVNQKRYVKSAEYRAEVAREKYDNQIEAETLAQIRSLINQGKFYLLDKENMIPWQASSAMLFKDGILIVHPC